MSFTQFPRLHFDHLDRVELPRVARVRLQHPVGEPLADVAGAVRDAVLACARLRALPKGSSVAIALGSRGIADIALVGRATVAALRELGHEPFVVPAMGSHGGGTAVGQVEVLARLGMSEDYLQAPVRATMDVVDYGETPDGARCKFDANAAGADAIVVVNRVKSHTSFDRTIESGLVKMTAVGLGKAEGARAVHRTGPRGLIETLPALARLALASAPIVLGIALVENALKKLIVVEGVAPERFFEADERLLVLAKSFLPRLPFDQADAMVVEQIGKDVSGAGMDYAATGRSDIRSVPNPETPFIARIAALGLSKATGGNGVGIGLADFSTAEVVERIDLRQIYMNSLTSTLVEKSRMPLVMENDLAAVRAAVATSWSDEDRLTRLCQIRSTSHLEELLVSETLLPDARQSPLYRDEGEPFELRFDARGRLLSRAYAGDEAGRGGR